MSFCAQNNPRVIGIVVTFDPERNPLAIIESVLESVERLVIVDNAPDGHPALSGGQYSHPQVSIIRNANVGGLAGAYNAAIAVIRHSFEFGTHVLFLDDDTDASSLRIFLESDSTRAFAASPDVAAVAPAYVDRATGLRGRYIQLSRFAYKVLPREMQEPVQVSFLINSMSLWRLDAITQIGPYNARLAVDHVDTDYCVRAGLAGYRLILAPQFTFLHSIGARRAFRLMGRTMQAGGHNPQRRKMIARNTVLLARRYGLRLPAFAVLCIARLAYEIIGVAIAESDRSRKLWSITAGGISGLFSRYAD